jgi:hypothetical protein
METTIAEARRIQYNFKPHMALQGKTPSKKARIEINVQNKWLEICSIIQKPS